MSENLDLVRSTFAAMERGDFVSSVEWADPEVEWVIADGPEPSSLKGVTAYLEWWRDFLIAWEGYRIKVDEYRELDDDRVLVLLHSGGGGARTAARKQGGPGGGEARSLNVGTARASAWAT